jgi:hypothetical protein
MSKSLGQVASLIQGDLPNPLVALGGAPKSVTLQKI